MGKITHEEWAEIDHANLQQKYFVLEKQPNPYDIPVEEEKKETPSSSREEELVEWLNVQKKRVGDLKMEKYAIQKEKEEVVQWLNVQKKKVGDLKMEKYAGKKKNWGFKKGKKLGEKKKKKKKKK